MLSITVEKTGAGLSPPACALLAGDICMALTADPPPDFLRGRSVVIFCKGRNRQVRLRCRRSVVGTKFCEPKDGGSFSPKSLQLIIIAAAASTGVNQKALTGAMVGIGTLRTTRRPRRRGRGRARGDAFLLDGARG